MKPVSAPAIHCRHCGKPTSLWMPLCPDCGELPPVIGEKFRDVPVESAIELRGEEPQP